MQSIVKHMWGNRLVPVPEDILSRKPSLRQAVQFLRDVGLPTSPPLLMIFHTDERLLRHLKIHDEDYWEIGSDEGTKLVLDKEHSVLAADPQGVLPIRFVNSKIGQFVLFLGMYEQYQKSICDANDGEAKIVLGSLRDQFTALDARAISNPENWWSLVLEQAEQRLL